MTNNMYDEITPGDDGIKGSLARRDASVGALHSDESEQFLADVARAKAEGLKLSPTMTMAAGYAQGYKDAAAKMGQK